MRNIEKFIKERESLNELVSEYSNKNMKRFLNLDGAVYKNENLAVKTKEMLGLSSSLVLRCDDCISYHINICFENGVTDNEISEILSVGLIVGGSITIPHIRRAIASWDELKNLAKSETDKEKIFTKLEPVISELIKSNLSLDEKLKTLSILLDRYVSYYDWTGFYIADKEQKFLYLGPYIGEPTDHKKIAFGQGICGQAASTLETFTIQDVSQETNYLSCSINVKSEIVVPIKDSEGFIFGELDIDSHKKSPFTKEDNDFLNKICELLVPVFQNDYHFIR